MPAASTVFVSTSKVTIPGAPDSEYVISTVRLPAAIETAASSTTGSVACAAKAEERTIDVHINRLRDKFKDNPNFEIITVRGLGYKVVKKDE